MKKIFALVLAMLFIVSATAAFAATITVTNVDPTADTNSTPETYTAYKIFDAVKASGVTVSTSGTTQTASGAITYTIDKTSDWFAVLFNNDGTAQSGNLWFTATKIDGSNPEKWQINPAADYNSEQKAKDAAAWLLAHKGSITGTPLTVGQGNSVDDGYYLVTSSLGTNLGLATTDIPMTIVEKNTFPNVDKTQKDGEDTTGSYADSNVQVQVGDTINYQVVVYVPATVGGDITVEDTMSAGLTPAAASTVAYAAGTYNETTKVFTAAEPAITLTSSDVEVANGTNPVTYSIRIHPTANTKGKHIQFTFSATVNSNAIVDNDKENEVDLTYSNYSQHDEVHYEIYKSGLVKYDGDTGTVDAQTNVISVKTGANAIVYLAGAQFELYDNDGTTRVLVSYNDNDGYYYPDASGTAVITSVNNENGIKFRGLDNHDYKLKEIKAPDGYTLIPGFSTLHVEADSDAAVTNPCVLKVENNKGSVLPSTGGIGTTIFYVGGSILVLAAAILLITKRRMSSND